MANRTLLKLELETEVYDLANAAAAYWMVRAQVCSNLRGVQSSQLHTTDGQELPDAKYIVAMSSEEFEAFKYIADQLAGHAKQVTDWVFTPEKTEPPAA
jgi:hypothetical protein